MSEISSCNILGCLLIAFVVSVNGVNGTQSFIRGREAEKATSCRKYVAESGFLRYDWTPGGKVRGAAIAEPTCAQPNVLILRDRELRLRVNDVFLISIQIV